MYSLVIYEDHESLTVEGKTVEVPLFYAVSTAMDFLRHLDQPWKIDREDGAVLCMNENEPEPFDLEKARMHLLSDGGLAQRRAGAGTDLGTGGQTARLEQTAASEYSRPEDGILMGWKFGQVDGIDFTISFDYQGADRPYRMPTQLAGNRTSKPFFHSDAELISLQTAVDNWLLPRVGERRPGTYLKPSQQLLARSVQLPDDPDIHKRLAAIQAEYGFGPNDGESQLLWLLTYMEGTFRYRTGSVGAQIMVTTDGNGRPQSGKLYKSDSFLALAWIEIMWALDHEIYARTCQSCGTVFRLGGPYTRKFYLCSPACRRQRRIDNRGGLEELRQYNRERQRASRRRRQR